jgi:hypothetical protein
MKKIIEQIFNNHTRDFDYIYIGNKMIITLDDARRIEVDFYNTWSSNNYDSLRIVLVSKTHGYINSRIIKFKDLFDNMQDTTHPNRIDKHIWYNGEFKWYGKPNDKDIIKLQKTLEDYIDTWK